MTKSVPKWMQRMIDLKVHPDVIAQRAELRRLRDREWAVKNKEAKAAHKRAYKAKKKAKAYQGMTIKSMYHPNWKEAPVYECPELTYRGKV